MQRYELEAWLGPALDNLTTEQVDRIHGEVDRIDARYPHPDDEDLAQASLTAAVQYLLGDITPIGAGHVLAAARRREAEAMAAAQQIAAMAVSDGMSEVKAAKECSIDRMTLRKVLGKR